MGKHLAQPKRKHIKPKEELDKQPLKLNLPSVKEMLDFIRMDKAGEDELLVDEADRVGEDKLEKGDVIFVIVLFALFSILWLLPTAGWVRFASYVILAAISAVEVLRNTIEDLASGSFFNHGLLTLVVSLCCFFIGEFIEAAFVILFYRLSMLCEAYLEDRRRRSLEAAKSILPVYANLETVDGAEKCSAQHLSPGDVFVVYPGEIIPLDGVIIEGTSALDTSALTGNKSSRAIAEGSEVYSGCVNLTNPLRVRAVKSFEDSAASKAVAALKDSDHIISRQEWRSSRTANLLVPAISILGLLLAVVISVSTGNWREWISRGLVFIAVANFEFIANCINTVYFAVTHKAFDSGIVFKGYDGVESFASVETMVFNKTGTLTERDCVVTEIYPVNISERDLLVIAATAEGASRHPVAEALRSACGMSIPEEGDVLPVEEIPGRGISAFIHGRHVYVGNVAHLMDHGINFMVQSRKGNVVHVAIDNEYAGHIVITERTRNGAFDALEELHVQGVNTTVMLTGEGMSTARQLASSLNFDMVKAELRPEGKVSALEYLMATKNKNSTLACVADPYDGNDLLDRADVGIIIDALGADGAIDRAGLVILDGDIRKLSQAHAMALSAVNSVKRMLVVVASVKGLLLLFALLGFVAPWLAVLADFAASVYVLYKTIICF